MKECDSQFVCRIWVYAMHCMHVWHTQFDVKIEVEKKVTSTLEEEKRAKTEQNKTKNHVYMSRMSIVDSIDGIFFYLPTKYYTSLCFAL